MLQLEKITIEILEITNRIRDKFPALYKILNETPLFFSPTKADIELADYQGYLESLQMQLDAFEQPKFQ